MTSGTKINLYKGWKVIMNEELVQDKEEGIEVTEDYIHIPVKRKKKNMELRTITITKGIKALYDVKNKVIVTYLFSKKNYTVKQAKKWIKEHSNIQTDELLMQLDSLLSRMQENDRTLHEEIKKAILEAM